MELYGVQNPWTPTYLGPEAGPLPGAAVRLTDDFLEYSPSALASRSFSLNSLTFRDGDAEQRVRSNAAYGAVSSTQCRLYATNVQIKQERHFTPSECEGPLTAVEQTYASNSMSQDGHAALQDLESSPSPSSSLSTSSVSSVTSSSTTASDLQAQQHLRPGAHSRGVVERSPAHSRRSHLSSTSSAQSQHKPDSQQEHHQHQLLLLQQQQQQLQLALRAAPASRDIDVPSSSQVAVAKRTISTAMVSLAASAGSSGSGHHGGHHGGHPGGHHSATLAGNSQRLQRNNAEKQRRDKLNSSISELATIVPMVGMSSKRLDKTSILRLSAGYLRFHQLELVSQRDFPGVIQESQGGPVRRKRRWRPSYVNHNHLRELIDALEGFFLMTNMHGKIIYVTPTVERFLGHQHIEMIGHPLSTFMHSADVENVQMKLQSLFSAKEQYRIVGDQLVCDDVSFFCRIREKTQPRSEVITYQAIYASGRIVGPARFEDGGVGGGAHCTALAHLNPSRFLLKAFVRILNASPYKELSLSDANRDEYVTRHNLDGTIIYADHRIAVVTGHLPHEVVGICAHNYIDPSDVVIAQFAQKQMLASHSGKGVVVYRLRTRGDDFIYLRTSGYLHYDQSTMQVDHFVCVNTLMSKDEGERERQELCNRFSPHINSMTVEHLNEFFSSVHTHTLRRIQRSKESTEINSKKHVPGGTECNPLALENLVEPNLLLGSNCFVKLKTKNDSDDFENISVQRASRTAASDRGSCIAIDNSPSECSAMSASVQSIVRDTRSSSPASRSNDSPENSNPPLTPSTSPITPESVIGTTSVEITKLTQGHYSSNINIGQLIHGRKHDQKQLQQEQSSREAIWSHCDFSTGALPMSVSTHHRSSSSASTGGYGTLASPSSMSSSPLSDDTNHHNM